MPKQSTILSNSDLMSRYIDIETVPWEPTTSPGIDIKILYADKNRGLMTALFRWAPGSRLTLHEHTDIEQTYVIEGSLADDEGEATQGNFVWRPTGSRHEAWSPNGAITLSIFLAPNKFDGPTNNKPKSVNQL